MLRLFLLLGGWVVAGITGMQANIIRVPGDQLTIQAGIDAANPGDTVLAVDGRYFENVNFRGKSITVASHFLLTGDRSHIANWKWSILGQTSQRDRQEGVFSSRAGCFCCADSIAKSLFIKTGGNLLCKTKNLISHPQ